MAADATADLPIIPWSEFKATLDLREDDAEKFCQRHDIAIIHDGPLRFIAASHLRRAVTRIARRARNAPAFVGEPGRRGEGAR